MILNPNNDRTALTSKTASDQTARVAQKSASVAIFTLPKPFTDPHIDLIQRNAICSWKALDENVDVILMGDDDGIDIAANELGVQHNGDIRKNEHGTPLLSDAFRSASQMSDAEILIYCNCDVILLNDLVRSIELVQKSDTLKSFVAFSRRTDLDVTHQINFDRPQEIAALLTDAKNNGIPAPVVCKEYFAFTRDQYIDIPDFAVGRGNWDNWMLAHAKSIGLPVIDFTPMVKIIHQSHDYSHLKASRMNCYVTGKEALQNQKLAGGSNVIGGSTGTWSLTTEGLKKNWMSWANKNFWLDLPRFLKMVIRVPFQR